MDQPGKVANPTTRGQLNRENECFIFPCQRSRLIIWSRETSSIVQSAHLRTQAESGAYLQDIPEFRGGVCLFIKNRHTHASAQFRVNRVTQ